MVGPSTLASFREMRRDRKRDFFSEVCSVRTEFYVVLCKKTGSKGRARILFQAVPTELILTSELALKLSSPGEGFPQTLTVTA